MAKVISDYGKRTLFSQGWRSRITKIRLCTTSGTIVDEQDITFVMNTGTGTMYLSAPVIFNVASGTTNVSQVKLFQFTSPDVYDLIYTEDLASTYNFTTEGTLTLNTYTFSVSGGTLEGRNKLWNDGWASVITWAKLYRGETLVDTKTCSFTASIATGNKLTLDASLIFAVPVSAISFYYIHLGYTDAETDKELFEKTGTSVAYPTVGTYRVNTWEISV